MPSNTFYIDDIWKWEIRRMFVNEKERGTGSLTDWRIRINDITASYVEDLVFSFLPGNKLSL